MNRKYISEEYQHQYKDGRGTPYAVLITAENTTMHVVEKYQGAWRYDAQRGEKILFNINFKDTGLSMSSKVKNHVMTDNEGIYAQYALECMEMCDDYEEYYKTALLITKNFLKRSIESHEKEKAKFEETGFWSWPINLDPKLYENSYELNKKTFESIEICEDDLKFFKQFSHSDQK
jgi:hypothetical protein